MNPASMAQSMLARSSGSVGDPNIHPNYIGDPNIHPNYIGAPIQSAPQGGTAPITYSETEYVSGDVTWFGFGITAIIAGTTGQVVSIKPLRPITPQKIFCPSTNQGLLLGQASVGGTEHFREPGRRAHRALQRGFDRAADPLAHDRHGGRCRLHAHQPDGRQHSVHGCHVRHRASSLKIATVLGAEFHGGQIAYFAKCAIEAFAKGSVPMAGVALARALPKRRALSAPQGSRLRKRKLSAPQCHLREPLRRLRSAGHLSDSGNCSCRVSRRRAKPAGKTTQCTCS